MPQATVMIQTTTNMIQTTTNMIQTTTNTTTNIPAKLHFLRKLFIFQTYTGISLFQSTPMKRKTTMTLLTLNVTNVMKNYWISRHRVVLSQIHRSRVFASGVTDLVNVHVLL